MIDRVVGHHMRQHMGKGWLHIICEVVTFSLICFQKEVNKLELFI